MKRTLAIMAILALLPACAQKQEEAVELDERQVEMPWKPQDEQSKNFRNLESAILEAVKRGNLGEVEDIIVKANHEFRYILEAMALHKGVERGDKALVEFLLNQGIDIDAKCKGLTALHIAANEGHKDIVELLIARGADVNALDINSTYVPPLHMAITGNHPNIVEILINNGAGVNQRDFNAFKGYTPLYLAIKSGNKEILRLILAEKPNLEVVNRRGNRPLHIACTNRQLLELLLEAGADVNALNFHDETALDIALGREKEAPEIVELLLRYGARRGEELKWEKEQGE